MKAVQFLVASFHNCYSTQDSALFVLKIYLHNFVMSLKMSKHNVLHDL